MMQAGFDPGHARMAGTPVSEPMPSAAAARIKNSFAQRVFDNSMACPDPTLSLSENAIYYRKQPTVLRGMELQAIPNGGFPATDVARVIPGADGEYNVRMPTYFTLPAETEKRCDVGPTEPLTGLGPHAVYRVPDGKVRAARGAMSIARAEEEARRGRAAREAAMARALGEEEVIAAHHQPAAGPAPAVATFANPRAAASRPLPVALAGDAWTMQLPSPPPSNPPQSAPTFAATTTTATFSGTPAPAMVGVTLAESKVTKSPTTAALTTPAAFVKEAPQHLTRFLANLWAVLTSTMTAEDMRNEAASTNQWLTIVVVVLAVAVACLLGSTIGLAVQAQNRSQR